MTNAIHPALAQAPKSTREALERALNYVKTKTVAKSQYVDRNGNFCIIGQFFTPEQIERIKCTRDKDGLLNDLWVHSLANSFGKKNIEAMTGLTIAQANSLQYQNDNFSKEELIFKIESVLLGEAKTLTLPAQFNV